MKHSSHAIESNPHPRSGSLADLGSRHFQQGFDVPPENIRPDGFLENRLPSALVIRSHRVLKVSLDDTGIKRCFSAK